MLVTRGVCGSAVWVALVSCIRTRAARAAEARQLRPRSFLVPVCGCGVGAACCSGLRARQWCWPALSLRSMAVVCDYVCGVSLPVRYTLCTFVCFLC